MSRAWLFSPGCTALPALADDYDDRWRGGTVISTQTDNRSRHGLSKRLIQSSFNEILVFDASSRKIVDANRAARTKLQYTLQEMKKLEMQDIFAPGSGKSSALIKTLNAERLSGTTTFDCSLRRKDGTTFPAEVRLFPARESEEKLNVAIIHDLTTQEASRRALVQRDSDYQALVSNIPGMAYQIRCAPDGTISFPFVSSQSRMLLGMKPQALQDNPGLLLDLIVPEDRPSYEKALADANGCHMAFNWEGRIWIEAWKDFKWINIRTSRRETAAGTLWDGIMLNITQSKLAKEELERSKEELRLLTLHIQRAKEAERKRLAQEMHDELGGNLTAIKIAASSLLRNSCKDRAKSEQRLHFLEEVVDNTLDAIYRMSRDLRPPILDFGIISAIRWQTEQLARTAGIDCRFVTRLKHVPMDDEAAVAVFRVAQEAMTNIAKHANATQVEVSLGQKKRRLQLCISDNGIGVQDTPAGNRERSFGVMGMHERASALGGSLAVEPGATGGTTVRLEIPLLPGRAGTATLPGNAAARCARRPAKSVGKQGV